MHLGWTVITLFKMYQPGRLTPQLSQSFTNHLKAVSHFGVKNQRQSRKPATRDLIWKIGQSQMLLAILFDRHCALFRFCERSHIVKGTGFFRDRTAHLIELLMQQVLDGSDARHITHKLLNRVPRHFDEVCRATDIRRNRRSVAVDRSWLPWPHGKCRFGSGDQWIDSGYMRVRNRNRPERRVW